MRSRLPVFILVFALLNLGLVPLLSLYGLRICPVLAVAGFTMGCTYTGSYVAMVTLLNTSVILILSRPRVHASRWQALLTRSPMVLFMGCYLVASGISLAILQAIFHLNHLSGFSRAPEVLALASLLLGVIQAYGLAWAGLLPRSRSTHSDDQTEVRRFWAHHSLRDFFPAFLCLVVLVHFLLRQSSAITPHMATPPGSPDELIGHTVFLLLCLITWLVIAYAFHIASELDQVQQIESHLQAVERMDFEYRSRPAESWGLWEAITRQLNRFSGQMGVNTRRIESLTQQTLAAQAEAMSHKQQMIETLTHQRERLEIAVAERTQSLVDTQKKLIASEKMAALGVFTAGMAHEINNPANFVAAGAQNAHAQLSTFKGFIGELLDEDTDPAIMAGFDRHFSAITESVDLIKSGVKRIENVVKHLRSAHPEAQQDMHPADLASTLELAWSVFSPTLPVPVYLTTNIVRPCIAECRVAELHQVFLALLSNAAHAIEDAMSTRGSDYRGEITISARAETDVIVIGVSDNGLGMDGSTLDKAFDPFFTTKAVGRGSGLGLSMARDVMAAHHGTLEAVSQPEAGSTFTLRIPTTPPEIP